MVTRRRRLAFWVGVAAAFAASLMVGAYVWRDTSRSAEINKPPTTAAPLPPLRTVFNGELEGLQTLRWQEARAVSDTQLDVLYDGSPPGCRELANVRIAERPDRVTITVFEGQIPSAVNQICPAIGQNARVRVTLTAPVGNRRLFDGSANPPIERQLSR